MSKPDIDDLLAEFGMVATWPSLYEYGKAKSKTKQAIFNRLAAEAVDGATYHSPGLSNNTKVLPISKLKAIMEIKDNE